MPLRTDIASALYHHETDFSEAMTELHLRYRFTPWEDAMIRGLTFKTASALPRHSAGRS